MRQRKLNQDKRALEVEEASKRVKRLTRDRSRQDVYRAAAIIESTGFSENELKGSGLAQFFRNRPTLTLRLIQALHTRGVRNSTAVVALETIAYRS